MFLCKAWLASATEEFYREFELSEYNFDIVRQIIEEQQPDNQLQHIGPWVQKLAISNNEVSNKMLSLYDAIALFSCFPNLKIIDFTRANDVEWYTNIMYKYMDIETCFGQVKEICISFETSLSKTIMTNYFLVCHKLRANISTCCFFDTKKPNSKASPSVSAARGIDINNTTSMLAHTIDISNNKRLIKLVLDPGDNHNLLLLSILCCIIKWFFI
jgi:hypothetical protein